MWKQESESKTLPSSSSSSSQDTLPHSVPPSLSSTTTTRNATDSTRANVVNHSNSSGIFSRHRRRHPTTEVQLEEEEENIASWTTEDEDESDVEEEELASDSSSSSRTRRAVRNPRPYYFRNNNRQVSASPSPSPVIPRARRQRLGRRSSTRDSSTSPVRRSASPSRRILLQPSVRERIRAHTSLPLLTQIRLLIERALAQQLQENRSLNPKRSWFRRQIDTLFLRLLVFIMWYHREVCIIFLLFASGLATLKTTPMKTRSTPDPKPFFENPASLQYISDFYRGQYIELVQNKINLGPAFVFYYAPWDSESVAARNVFVNVAHYFRHNMPHRVRFFAVNCWWPQGECRKNYKNLSHFPIFVAHVERNAGIIYSGPIRAELIIRFLTSVLRPLTRIDTDDELWRFRAQHDAIMLSYFNFTEAESVRAYETYRQMALRNFEADPFGQVGFGILLKQELAEKYFLTSSNVISLVLFNEIHTAKWTGEKETPGPRGPVGQVANWVMERTKKTPITWAYQIRTGFANRPVALGPMDLADEISKGPVILLITRRYFPSSYSPFYAQVKEVALDYFNCNKSGNVTRLRRTTHQINSEWLTLWNSISKVCLTQEEDGPSTDNCVQLRDQLEHWYSKRHFFHRVSLSSYEGASGNINFTGFSCTSDRQFKFFAIDPIDLKYFVQLGLGGLGFDSDSDPVLFVIDAQNDMIVPFRHFNITQIAEVIMNYTLEVEDKQDEPKSFTSSLWSDSSVHEIKSLSDDGALVRNDGLEMEDRGYSFVRELVGGGDNADVDDHPAITVTHKQFESETKKVTEASRGSLVLNVNSEDIMVFLKGVEPFHLKTPMFLMYTAKFCGTCGVALSSFVELSRFIKDNYSAAINVTFAKIDMVKNSLPRALAPESLPTFAFFPGDESDVRTFPGDERITTKTLLRFLLGEVDSETRINLSLQSPKCSTGEDKYCEAPIVPSTPSDQIEPSCGSPSNVNKTKAARNECLVANKLSVDEKLLTMLKGIKQSASLNGQNQFLKDNTDSVKMIELEYLRSMRLSLGLI